MAVINIPTPLRKFTDNNGKVSTSGKSIREAMRELAEKHPGLKQHIFDDEGNLRKFLRIYLGETDIKAIDNEETGLNEASEVNIIPAIAGGMKS